MGAASKKRKKADAGRYLEVVTDIYVGLMLSVFILWFQKGGFAIITESKYYFFRNLTLAYLIVTLILWGELLAVGELKLPSFKQIFAKIGPAGWCILAYTGFCVLSALLSDFGKEVWIGLGRYEGLSTIILYTASFIAVCLNGRLEKWMFALAGGVLCVFSIVCLLQFYRYNPFSLYQGDYHYDGVFLGTTGNVNMIGTLLSMFLPFLLGGITVGEGKKKYYLLIPMFMGSMILWSIEVDAALVAIAAVLVAMITVVCTDIKRLADFFAGCSAAGLGFAVAELMGYVGANGKEFFVPVPGKMFWLFLMASLFAVIVFFLLQKDKIAGKVPVKAIRFAVPILVSAVAVAAVVILKWFCPVSDGMLYQISRLLNGDVDPTLGSHRALLWSESLKLVKESPLFGGGPDSLAGRLTVDVVLDPRISDQVQSVVVESAHNEYINILVNTGIFSLVAYMAGLISLFVFWVRSAGKNKEAAILGCAVLGYCVQAFFCFSITITTPVFWILLGLLQSSSVSEERKVPGR